MSIIKVKKLRKSLGGIQLPISEVIFNKDKTNQQENNAWERVKLARSKDRFRSIDIINGAFEYFTELHGDRIVGDDKSIICGIAFFKGIPVTIISQEKGKNKDEMKYRQYGMNSPEGYRKSVRLMKQAEKFNRPIICFVDTPGAFPGIAAEEHGQAEAIARNLQILMNLKVPIITFFIGEGGSGGALALGVANKMIIMENAVFSVVSPEGCASILWKNTKMANVAAEQLKMTSYDLKKAGIIDEILLEQGSFDDICERISQCICNTLRDYMSLTSDEIVKQRKNKFRTFDQKFLKMDWEDNEINNDISSV